eukprot:COSAG02_NODE_1173_length_14105_cov_15.197701_15_plen_84_part_00
MIAVTYSQPSAQYASSISNGIIITPRWWAYCASNLGQPVGSLRPCRTKVTVLRLSYRQLADCLYSLLTVYLHPRVERLSDLLC